jgi:hypothetical protein
MSISVVGSLYSAGSPGLTSLSVSPTAVGDCLLLAIGYSSTSPQVATVSGGGCSSWTKLTRGSGNGFGVELWLGVISTPGSATITLTYSPSDSVGTGLTALQFTAYGAGTVWAVDNSQVGTSTAASGPVDFASLTPSASGDLYYGAVRDGSTTMSTSSSGYTVANGTSENSVIYNPSCSSSAQAPTASVAGAGSATASALIIASPSPSTHPGNFMQFLYGG